jgi:glyoxylase-like metal-dependent hydrolase (beta-lactamase superfamily II)
MKWSAWRTTFVSRASPSPRASRRILIGITCSGMPNSATRLVTVPPAARPLCKICGRNADWKSRVAEGLPPEIAEETPLDLYGIITGLPAETAQLPWDGPKVRIIEHPAHSPGHAALLIEERGVLAAGDMLSDVFVPMLDNVTATNDPVEEYLVGLRLLEDVADGVDVVVPGHGSVGRGDQVRARINQDRAYVAALRDGQVPSDPRVESPKPGWEWVSDIHEGQLQSLARRGVRDGAPG